VSDGRINQLSHESASSFRSIIVVYYETIKERLRGKPEESTRLSDTGLFGELEHLKIKTRLIDEKFASVMGECVI
jgi:hypothetical protein